MQETRVLSLGREDPLEKEMATHSSILTWKIPWMEEPGGLQSTGSQRVGHNWATSLTLPLGLTGWISLLSKELSRVFSSTTVWKHEFFGTQPSLRSNSHAYMTTWKTIALIRLTFVGKVMSLLFNMMTMFVIAFLPRSKHLLISWLQSPSKVILEPKKRKSVTAPTFCPSICHEGMGLPWS